MRQGGCQWVHRGKLRDHVNAVAARRKARINATAVAWLPDIPAGTFATRAWAGQRRARTEGLQGQYLSLLSALHDATVPVTGVDGFRAETGLSLAPEKRVAAEQLIRDNVALMTGCDRPVHPIGGFTRDVSIAGIVACCPGGYGFISVDAGHQADDPMVGPGIACSAAGDANLLALQPFRVIATGTPGDCVLSVDAQ
jgi:hypothetical protein